MIHKLPRFNPRNFQTQIIQDVILNQYKRMAISVTRRGGKDYIALACADMMAQVYPGSNIGYLGLSLKSLKKILFSNDETGRPMYRSVINCEHFLVPTRSGDYFHKDTGAFKYKNGSLLYLLGTDTSMELGTSMKMLVITEASRIPFDAWEFLEPSVEGSDGTILQVSTPFFGSDFNDLLAGDHKQSKVYKTHIVPANILKNADGTRVYPDERLERIKARMDKASFEQEYMCNVHAINKISIMGYSLEHSKYALFPQITDRVELNYSFDLGQADSCAMTGSINEIGKNPIIFDFKIENRTNIKDFTDFIREQSKNLGIPPQRVNIILPFDSDQTFQGYGGKINRYQEIKKEMSGYNVQLVGRTDKMRGIQVSRTVLETGKIMLCGELKDGRIQATRRVYDWIKIIASINYKVERSSNKISYVVDKRSGIHEDHPLDSLRYKVLYKFRDLFDDKALYDFNGDDIRDKSHDYMWEGQQEVNEW